MNLEAEPYVDQAAQWPAEGRHILAQYNDRSIIIYQAYRATIASYAVATNTFGRDFSYARMSWIIPNFLWMMYRSGWGGACEKIAATSIVMAGLDPAIQ